MSHLPQISRRKFLTNSALASTAASIPMPGFAQEKMITRTIPGTSEQLPIMGLGSPLVFYGDPPEGPAQATSLVQAMYDMGGRVIDTPAFFRPYPPNAGPLGVERPPLNGEHLPALGSVINNMGLQNDLFLTGKISTSGKQEGIDHIDRMIANLNKRPLDLMMTLNFLDVENQWPTLKEAKAEGKVRYIGASLTNSQNVENFDLTPIEDFMRNERPDFFLLGYSMFQNGPAERVLPLAQDLGIAIIGAEVFKTRTDGAYFSMIADKELPEWAAEFDCDSWAQYALKYVASHPAITTVITETSSVRHVIDNMGAGYGRLPDEAMRKRMFEHFQSLT